MSILRFLPVVGVAVAPVLVSAACYGPTEVTVVLSTDLPCNEDVLTTVYKGPPFGDPETDTKACTAVPNADSEIGSLVFVPSGSANGKVGVKAVLARRGRPVSACATFPEDCIVATRSFSFVEHLSRRVPIRMLSACLGKICPDGKTCVEGGECADDNVTCDSDDCRLVDKDAGTTPPSDGGVADAALDVTVPIGKCSGPDGSGVLSAFADAIPEHAAAAADAFFFFAAAPQPSVMRVSKLGGPPVPAYALPPKDSRVLTLTSSGSSYGVVYASGGLVPESYWLATEAKGSPFNLGAADPNSEIVSLAPDPTAGIAYIARLSRVDQFKPGATVDSFYKDAGGTGIAIDGRALFLSQAKGIAFISRANSALLTTVVITPGPRKSAVFGSDGTTVYAAGNDKSGVATIVGLDSEKLTTTPGVDGVAPVMSLAVDATHLYWTDGKSIRRRRRPSAIGPIDREETLFPTAGADTAGMVDHLAVDGECVYFWHQPPGIVARAELRVMPKTTRLLSQRHP